jgi:hypothetical protein
MGPRTGGNGFGHCCRNKSVSSHGDETLHKINWTPGYLRLKDGRKKRRGVISREGAILQVVEGEISPKGRNDKGGVEVTEGKTWIPD